jgi:hypothetical protein
MAYKEKYLKYKRKYLNLSRKMNAGNNPNIYFTHDNGGKPFKVIIDNHTVKIYKQILDSDKYEVKPILIYKPIAIFIGRSPMTKNSVDSGPEFDGNSILLQIGNNIYTYIGSEIFSFDTRGKIIKYVSPIGNNDVPYPYAIDEFGNIYLLTENIVIKNNEKVEKQMKKYDDPYEYYYDYALITLDNGRIPPKQPKVKNFWNIQSYLIGSENYTLTYEPVPEKRYDEILSMFKEQPYLIDTNNKKIKLTKSMYVKLMNDYGISQSFEPIKNKQIHQQRL